MKEPQLIKFGKRLKALREHCKLTQAEIAERADISENYYSQVECGRRNIALKNLYAVSKGFKITISQLFDDKYLPKIKITAKKKSQKKRKG